MMTMKTMPTFYNWIVWKRAISAAIQSSDLDKMAIPIRCNLSWQRKIRLSRERIGMEGRPRCPSDSP
jgi:hypothetical protein